MPDNLLSFFSQKKVLITGHTGFKGSWLTWLLAEHGAHVIGVAQAPHTSPNLFSTLKLESRISHHVMDIRNRDRFNDVLAREQPEIVFHLAAQALVRHGYDNPYETFSTNVMGTINILDAVYAHPETGVKAIVVITTDKVYRDQGPRMYQENDPLGGYDPYAASKVAADVIAHSYSTILARSSQLHDSAPALLAIARSGNVIGGGDWSRDRLIPDIVRALYEGPGSITIRHPQAIRPWQHVFEPLSGYLMLAKRLHQGDEHATGAWNFGPSPENCITVEELLRRALTILGKGSYTIDADRTHKHETDALLLDSSKARSLLTWRPILTLEETLEMTLGWYRQFYKNPEKIPILTEKQSTLFLTRIKKYAV